MKTSEMLRRLADLIDAKEKESEKSDHLAQQPDDIFIPPLQLKLELLKKATGVENVYDEDANDEESHSYDEISVIKKNAGIPVVALDALGDDEPLDV